MSGSQRKSKATWRLPLGVSRGVWDYLHSDSIAGDYDQYFAHHWLFRIDQPFVLDQLQRHGAKPGEWVADLGCGTGRLIVEIARCGYRGLAVDLSEPMLEQVRRKAQNVGVQVATIRANLVNLDCLATASVHHALSLFSTLGMIRERKFRQQALAHVRRIVRPGGLFIMHVHNYWYNARFPGGLWWIAKNAARAAVLRDCELGDKTYPYRGLPNMFLHVFRYREIIGDLRAAGFQSIAANCLDPRREAIVETPQWFGNWRAGGWLLVCS